jgi:hypothetical protein
LPGFDITFAFSFFDTFFWGGFQCSKSEGGRKPESKDAVAWKEVRELRYFHCKQILLRFFFQIGAAASAKRHAEHCSLVRQVCLAMPRVRKPAPPWAALSSVVFKLAAVLLRAWASATTVCVVVAELPWCRLSWWCRRFRARLWQVTPQNRMRNRSG